MDAATLLPAIFAALLAISVFLYVIFDGYDLGIGLLFPFVKERADRDAMVATVSPFWDANETWIVLSAGVLFIAFPQAYGEIFVALYIPTVTMLAGLIIRGCAFDFRSTAQKEKQPLWDNLFCIGSYIATLSQGIMIGIYVMGLKQTPLTWGFAILTGISVCFGYALLGSTWLIFKADSHIRQMAIRTVKHCIFLAFASIILISLATAFSDDTIIVKWLTLPNTLYVAPIPIACVVFGILILKLLPKLSKDTTYKWDGLPYLYSVLIVLCTFIGFSYSVFPHIIVGKLTIWEATSATNSLSFTLWGVALVLPLIIIYTFYVHRIFKGKITHSDHDAY